MIKKNYDYLEKFSLHGDSFASVGWNDERGQLYRFKQLSKNILPDSSVLDIGAGLGHFQEYLKEKNINVNYLGIEKIPSFVEKAKKLGRNVIQEDFNNFNGSFDYVVASGSFSTHDSIDLINAIPKIFLMTKIGFGFNFLVRTKYHDSLRTYNKNFVLSSCEQAGFFGSVIEQGYVKGEKFIYTKKPL